MTREEAIEVIEQDIPCEHDKDLIEALEMAISALSTEGEYIKKDDAISKILTEFVSREENGKVMCACADVKQTCADILDSLPTYSFPDSAENKGDLISRQAVEKLVWDYLRDGTYENIAFYEHFLDLPTYSFPDSAENKGEWIPIEEREPEVHKYVMFTTKTTRREIGYKAKEEPYYFLFGDSGAYVKSDYILAWMELPEPYKGE